MEERDKHIESITIDTVKRSTPKTISEIERLPLHLALIALAGVIAIIIAVPSFFITMGISVLIIHTFIGGLLLGIVTSVFCAVLGFGFLYAYVLGKRRPVAGSALAVFISLVIIPLGGLGGIIAGVMGLCGGSIGLLRKSRILPSHITAEPQVIDEIFLMYKDGRLIRHYTRRLKPSVDQDILSSMLVAVQDFVKDSFERSTGEDSSLDEMKFGEFKIFIGRGKWIIIAALVLGQEHGGLKEEIDKTVKNIEGKYKHLLKDWDGVLDKLRPLNKEIKDLIDGEFDGRTEYRYA